MNPHYLLMISLKKDYFLSRRESSFPKERLETMKAYLDHVIAVQVQQESVEVR